MKVIVSGARRRADTFFAHPPSPGILARYAVFFGSRQEVRDSSGARRTESSRFPLLGYYLRLERPKPCTPALFVSLKGPHAADA